MEISNCSSVSAARSSSSRLPPRRFCKKACMNSSGLNCSSTALARISYVGHLGNAIRIPPQGPQYLHPLACAFAILRSQRQWGDRSCCYLLWKDDIWATHNNVIECRCALLLTPLCDPACQDYFGCARKGTV
jgi:hypothetical protein